MTRAKLRVWVAWLITIVAVPFTPLVSPLNWNAQLLGLPAEAVVWLGWTVLICLSITIFAISRHQADQE